LQHDIVRNADTTPGRGIHSEKLYDGDAEKDQGEELGGEDEQEYKEIES
jgi:hypothetical protein